VVGCDVQNRPAPGPLHQNLFHQIRLFGFVVINHEEHKLALALPIQAVTVDQVNDALNSGPLYDGSVDLENFQAAAIGNVVVVQLPDRSWWDDKQLVSVLACSTLEGARRVFTQIPDAFSFTLVRRELFVDKYGNDVEADAARITINKETANKFNWENLKNQVAADYKNLLSIADDYYIQPAISEGL
jgi:hypothetical protein